MLPKESIEQNVRSAIEMGAEFPSVEFKGSAPFRILKYRIAKAAQAISNTRDGGNIIIGVKQRKGSPTILQGVTADIERTYDHETVYEAINKFASPPIEIQTQIVEYEGKRFVAIAVPPFSRTPTVCRSATPPGVHRDEVMRPGDVFIRPTDRIGTRKVQTAADMDELLQRATARRATEMLETVGAPCHAKEPPIPTNRERLDAEVDDIAKHF